MPVDEPRGAILNPEAAARAFHIERHPPGARLAPFVQHYWFARWSLPDARDFVQPILPLPAVNLTLETGDDGITGPISSRSDKTLSGTGRVFGVLFRPGGFHPFYARSMHTLVDRVIPISDVFPGSVSALRAALWASASIADSIALLDGFIGQLDVPHDPVIDDIQAIVDAARDDRALPRADALAERFGLSLRGLQRRLRRHLGLGPKALIRRFRLQEAAHLLATTPGIDQIELALRLGYYDQAHFVRDFATVIGEPPGRYASARRKPG